MKKLIILGALLLPSLIASCGIDPSVPSNLSAQDVDAEIRTATLDQLVERQGLYYEINSETPFMGLLRDVYPNGQKKREGNFVRGVLDGGMTAWYENGQKKYEGNFVNGKADGLVTIWYDNGQKKSEEVWVGGASQGKTGWNYDGNELSGDC
jgi:antitoxin component YwqK of YwqJK toxin-antitoxin module